MKTLKNTLIISLSLLFLSACSSLSTDEKNEQRQAIDDMAKVTIETLIKDDPSIEAALKNAKGYMVTNWKVTKVPIFGAGGGNGVVVDSSTDEHVYISVSRLDAGPGLGAKSYKNLMVVNDEKFLEKLKKGTFTVEAGVEVAAGTASAEGSSSDERFTLYTLSDGGASATATLRLVKSKLAKELN